MSSSPDTPGGFFAERADWILDPDAVMVVPTETGGWQVVLRIDGNYRERSDAEHAARSFSKMTTKAANRARHAANQVSAAQQRLDDL